VKLTDGIVEYEAQWAKDGTGLLAQKYLIPSFASATTNVPLAPWMRS